MGNTISILVFYVSVLLIAWAIIRLSRVSFQSLVVGAGGAVIGLLLGALASVPLSHLPGSAGSVLPLAVSGALTLAFVGAAIGNRKQLAGMITWHAATSQKSGESATSASGNSSLPRILVDTSVIIDGRIADIATAGFVPGRLVVPRFVLAELQNIADSDDAMRRGRGRRGLEVLGRLRDMDGVEVEVIEDDVAGIKEVDAKLVALGQRFSCSVLTTDFNLNQVAQIQGVRVLNVNELSNAIRPVVLPGEELHVRVVQPGKERNQGVGYLADGTMIVVENGDKMIGQEVITEVTRVFQTVAGKMIFATPKGKQPLIKTQPANAIAEPTTVPLAAQPTQTNQSAQPAQVSQPNSHHRGRKPRDKRNGGSQGRVSAEDRLIAATNNQPDSPKPQA